MFIYDWLLFPADNTAGKYLEILYHEGLLAQYLAEILHTTCKVRNKAVHENYSSETDCLALLLMAHSLFEWFMQTYGGWSY